MLVWSPNHCVSDAKREWARSRFGHILGSWGFGFMPVSYWAGGLGMWVQPLPWDSGLGAQPLGASLHLGKQAWVGSGNPFSNTGPLPSLQLTSTLRWPRRSMATTLSR